MSAYSTKEYTPFHKECTEEAIEQLLKYPKIVWDLPLREITSLVKFVNGLACGKALPNLFHDLIDIYYSEIHALFTSGRPKLT